MSHTLFSSHESVISFNEERDLELFESPNKSHTGVWKKFDQTQTKLGQNGLQEFFKNPTSNVTVLKNRQNILQKFLVDNDVTKKVTYALQAFSNNEFGFIDAADVKKNAVAQTIISSFYFEYAWLKKFNSSPEALDLKNTCKTLGLFSPLIEHIILHVGLEHIKNALGKNEDDHAACDHEHDHHDHICIDSLKPRSDASTLVQSLFIALQAGHWVMHAISFKEMIEYTQQQIAVINELYKQLAAIKICLESMELINAILKKDPLLLQAFGKDNPITRLFAKLSDTTVTSAAKELIDLLSDKYFDSTDDLSIFSSIGKTLRAHKLLYDALPELQPALTMVGQLDAYLSVATKLHKTEHANAQFCLVNFVENSDMPIIRMHKLWNIMLDQDHVIANDICLGDTHNPSKIIITGPNKTGKSSFIKALALNIIFAQTFGIAAAHSAEITVFNKVLSYITVTDDILNDKSMLVAEILRADQCLKDLKLLKKNEFAFVVIDDSLFKGTTFEKGQEAAYQFIKEIGSYDNSIACIATHLPALTKFEAGNSGFANYRIKIDLDRSGISYSTFTLEKGVSSPDDVFNVIRSQDYALSWL